MSAQASESQRVRWEDINFEGKEIYVKPEGKTGARRFILENKKTQDTEALWVWLNHFKSIHGEPRPFNPTANHEGIQKKSVPPSVFSGVRTFSVTRLEPTTTT